MMNEPDLAWPTSLILVRRLVEQNRASNVLPPVRARLPSPASFFCFAFFLFSFFLSFFFFRLPPLSFLRSRHVGNPVTTQKRPRIAPPPPQKKQLKNSKNYNKKIQCSNAPQGHCFLAMILFILFCLVRQNRPKSGAVRTVMQKIKKNRSIEKWFFFYSFFLS